MSSDLLSSVLSNIWVIFLVVLLFGGSIFVHELGHFLLARYRGAHVERFSIGFGPAIWSWRGRDGVEYRISWIPVGGYVLLPQLADLGAIEGESRVDVQKLPPVNYLTKMIVFAAGAAFNVLFAFLLACVVWVIGQPMVTEFSSTTIADVLPKIKTSDGREVDSPAAKAGLKTGDVIKAVDGSAVASLSDIQERIALSSGWTSQGERQTVLTIARDGKPLEVPVVPVLSGPEKIRMVGFSTATKLILGDISAGSPADKAGLKTGDQIVAIEGKSTLSTKQLSEALRAQLGKTVTFTVRRGDRTESRPVQLPAAIKEGSDFGFTLKYDIVYAHPSPFQQVGEAFMKTFRPLWALINPHSDINVSHLSGAIGIIDNFVEASRAGLPVALWFTIIVNVNLAILNLLPIPVLDGGQMLFATIARLRGRALPTNFIMAAQSVFLVLIFAMMGYITFFVDIPRMVRESHATRAIESSAPAQTAAPSK